MPLVPEDVRGCSEQLVVADWPDQVGVHAHDMSAGLEPFCDPARLLRGDRPMVLPIEHLPDRVPLADEILAATDTAGNPTDRG